MLTLVTLSTSLLQPFDGSSRVRASPDYASMASALAANVPLEAWSDALSQTPSYLVESVEDAAREAAEGVQRAMVRAGGLPYSMTPEGRAGSKSASPDYSSIASRLASSMHQGYGEDWDFISELPKKIPYVYTSAIRERAQDTARLMEAAYRSAPDYAKISAAAAAAGVALAYTHDVGAASITSGHGMTTHGLDVGEAAWLPAWQAATRAVPDYGAIAAAAAMMGTNFDDEQSDGVVSV